MAANDRQVAGDHYPKTGEQHWDMMWRLYREAWFVGNVTKYVTRYRKKNGVQDLEKAKHYLEKLIELETAAAGEETRKLPPPSAGGVTRCAICGRTDCENPNGKH